MADYQLYCLGRPILEKNGHPIKLEMRKSLALMVFLRTADHDYSRESLAALFWPEYDQRHALANLRRALSSLNKSLQGELLEADREKIGLTDRSQIWLDVDEFFKLLTTVKNHSHMDNQSCPECLRFLEEAVQLYRGNFLEGFNLSDCPAFDEWEIIQGENIRQEFAYALESAAEACKANSNWEQAITYARKWVALGQLNEPAHRLLIYLQWQAGQRSASLRQYDDLVKLLQDELGQKPEPETTDLYYKIRDGIAAPKVNRETDYPKQSPDPQFAEPLLKTKLYIPSSRRQKVYRYHIIHKLDQIEQYSLAILSAPAGFGKTTCLVEWACQTALPVGWYSLDSEDNEIVRFLAYLIAAFDSIQSGVGIKAQSLLKVSQSASPQLVLTYLLHELEELPTPSILVLDDYQFISAEAIHNAVDFILENLPPNVHLIIATRADPPLRLARFRSQEQLLEIRAHDLRFTTDEALEFLTRIMELPLTAEDVSLLNQRMEGWVVGFQMAAIALQSRGTSLKRSDVSQFIQSFSGSHRYILDYLTEEVLSRQPKIVNEFLLKTSILERLNSPVCDAVLGRWREFSGLQEIPSMPGERAAPAISFDSHQQILEYLERSNLFITALDDERCWFRYHHLFADLLRARLQRLFGAQEIAQLHIRASEWYDQNGSILEAIHHASMASDDERVERLIEQNYMEMVNRGEMSWLRFWTGELSKELVYRRPWLCIYEAQNHAWFGELDEADRLLEEAEKRIRAGISTPNSQSMLGHLAYIKSRTTAMRGDNQRGIELCLKARELIPASNLAMQLDISMTLAYEYFLAGDFSNASPGLNEIIHHCKSTGSIINMAAAHCVLARLYAVQGQLKKSYGLYQFAAQSIPETSGQHLGARALIEVGIAEVLYEWNDLDAALAHLEQGLALMPWWGKADDFVLAYITLGQIYLAQVSLSRAIENVGKAVQIIQTKGVFSEACYAVEIAQVNLWLYQGEVNKAAQWMEQRLYQANKSASTEVWQECADAACIRVLLALGKFHEAQSRLAQLTKSAEEGGRIKHLIELLALQALALNATENHHDALAVLHRALKLSQPEGYVRIFLDKGEPLASLLARCKGQEDFKSSPLNEYISTLLDAFEGERART